MFELTVVWVLLAAIVVGLAIARKVTSRGEDDVLHLRDSESGLISKQARVSYLLDRFDRWGKTVTVFLVVYGLTLLVVFLYRAWVQGEQLSR